jgi:hypothetical protein
MAISRRVEHLLRRDRATGTAEVLDDDGLLEFGRQRGVDLACDQVGHAAGRVGH